MERALLDPTRPEDQHIAERLRDTLIAWVTTMRPDGRPHLAAVWFFWEGDTILIFSQPNQKVRNLRANPSVALALDNTKDGDDAITIEGQAELLPAGTVTTEYQPYAAKYAARYAEMQWSAAEMAQTYTQAIRITPTRFRTVS